jgi:hypothetical protein
VVRLLRALPLLALACAPSASEPAAGSAPAPHQAAAAGPAAFRTGEALIEAMHSMYAGKWYKTLTFVQKRSFANGRVETWYEAGAMPGRLRIDIAPIDSGNTIVFKYDTVYQFRGGKLLSSRPQTHSLMVLGFDVYHVPASETAAKLRAEKFDLAKLHETEWQGRPTYVVGAAPGDTTSNQFWIDKERLVFVRMFERLPANPQNAASEPPLQEVQFNRYEKAGNGWVSPEVVFNVNGKRFLLEEYSDVRVDVPLDESLWDVKRYQRPTWMK